MSFIFKRRWEPAASCLEKPHGVYLLHGIGEHSGRYERLASWLTDQGWRVGAHDHPGHGQSNGKRGLLEPVGALSTQAAIQFQQFAIETNSTPILLGHSLGGTLAAELVIVHKLPVAGLVLSAPGLVPVMTIWDHVKLNILHTIAPNLCLEQPFDASLLTHDEIEVQANIDDKLTHSYISAALVNWLVDSGRRSIARANELDIDTLLLIPEADKLVDPAGSKAFAERAPAENVSVKFYSDFYHEIFNESPERRDVVMTDLKHWLNRFE